MEQWHYGVLCLAALCAMPAGALILNGEKGHWPYTIAMVAFLVMAHTVFPVEGGGCRVDWDGRGNPIECD